MFVFFHFLSNRSHFVRLPGGVSNDHPVISGVPQGAVMGPLLFLITISDINKDISSSKLISFADDTRIYSQIDDVSYCDNLQYGLNMIYDWAITNNMFFNAQNFHYVSFNTDPTGNKYNVYVNPKMLKSCKREPLDLPLEVTMLHILSLYSHYIIN